MGAVGSCGAGELWGQVLNYKYCVRYVPMGNVLRMKITKPYISRLDPNCAPIAQVVEAEGYECPEICSPEELLEVDK